jgi:hypothetical protein
VSRNPPELSRPVDSCIRESETRKGLPTANSFRWGGFAVWEELEDEKPEASPGKTTHGGTPTIPPLHEGFFLKIELPKMKASSPTKGETETRRSIAQYHAKKKNLAEHLDRAITAHAKGIPRLLFHLMSDYCLFLSIEIRALPLAVETAWQKNRIPVIIDPSGRADVFYRYGHSSLIDMKSVVVQSIKLIPALLSAHTQPARDRKHRNAGTRKVRKSDGAKDAKRARKQKKGDRLVTKGRKALTNRTSRLSSGKKTKALADSSARDRRQNR